MARRQKYSDKQIEAALRETRGLIVLAAERLGCCHATIHIRLQKSPKLRSVVQHYRRRRADMAEIALEKAIVEGQPWAVALALKTLGKSRGYVERVQSEVSGRKGGPIEVRAYDYHAAVAAIAARSDDDSDAPGDD